MLHSTFRRSASVFQRRSKADLASLSDLKPLSSLSPTLVDVSGGRSSSSGISVTVFGASGFVSRYVCNKFARIGSQVIAPFRGDGLEVRHLKLMGDLGQVLPIEFDIRDRNSITRAIHRSNVVVNLLGARRETINFSFDDVHHQAARVVAECAREAGVERLIHFSSIAADEHSKSALFKSKALGENVVMETFPDATIMRPAPIFGPEDSFLMRFAALIHHDKELPFLERHLQVMQPVWVGDVASAVMQSVLDPSTKGKVVELAGPETTTDIQVAIRVSTILQEITPHNIVSDKVFRNFLTFKQFEPHFRKYYSPDHYEQVKYHLCARNPPGALGFRDLEIAPATLEKFIEFSLKTQEQIEVTQGYNMPGFETGASSPRMISSNLFK